MKDKSKKSTYSTTFGVDPPIPQPLVLTRVKVINAERGGFEPPVGF